MPRQVEPLSQAAPPCVGFRMWAVLLVLAAAAPLLLFGWMALRWMAQSHADTFANQQADTARVLASAVDGELHAWKAVMTALAQSEDLQRGRLAEFYEEARRVSAQHDGWIVLTAPSGQQVLNTRRPYGAPLPMTNGPELVRAVLTGGQPVVSDLIFGPVVQRWIIAVAVPVFRDGTPVFMLDMTFAPERLTRFLERQHLPGTWAVSIHDRQQRTVTLLPLTEERIGKPVPAWIQAATRSADHGIVSGVLVEGVPGRGAFNRLTEAPWFLTLAIPLTAFPSPRPVYWFIVLGALLGCGTIALAVYASRKLTRPVTELAARAEEILRGEAPEHGPRSEVREIHHLEQALIQAATTVQALHREEARATAAEARAQAEAEGADALRAEIAQRQQAEEALRMSEEKFAKAFAANPAAMALTRVADGRILDVNEASLTLLGYTREEVLGRSVGDLGVWADPGLRGRYIEELHRTGQVREWEVPLVRKTGQRIDVLVSGELISVQGDELILSTFLDVTARKRAEAAVRDLARFPDENPHPVLRVTREGTLLYANRPSGPLLRGWQCQVGERLPADWCARVAETSARGTATEVEVTSDEGRVYSCILMPITPAGYLNLYMRDITARKQAEAALRQLNQDLDATVQARTAELARQARQLQALAAELTLTEQRERRRLADGLHEEHQQLLVAAKLRLHLLEQSQAPEVQAGCREVSALLQTAIERSRSLSRDLSPPLLYMGGLSAALTWLAGWMGEQYQLTVDVEADPEATPATEELTVLLYQAVRELLFNVVKHARVAAAQLTVATQDGQVRIVVVDAGVGFDPAQRLGTVGSAGGFGLFSIEQRLPLLGGRLEIDSAPGRGSRFTLWGPLRPGGVERAVSEPDSRPGLSRVPEGGLSRKLRLLLADDHAVVRQSLARLLSQEPDIEIVGEAADGKMAVELARQLQPDLVLMDVSMPAMDGIEATRAIRAECPKIQVIGLSMFESMEQAQAMREAGAAAYLRKSGPAEELLEALRRERSQSA